MCEFMISQTNALKIISTPNNDLQLRPLLFDKSIIDNLSETKMYSEPLPTTLTYRIEADDQLIGGISLQSIRWFNRKAEISIFISKQYQNRGLGKEALKSFIHYFFNTMNMHRLEAEVYEYNQRAQTIFENFGFKKEGRLREAKYFNGKYYDIIFYGLLKKEFNQRESK